MPTRASTRRLPLPPRDAPARPSPADVPLRPLRNPVLAGPTYQTTPSPRSPDLAWPTYQTTPRRGSPAPHSPTCLAYTYRTTPSRLAWPTLPGPRDSATQAYANLTDQPSRPTPHRPRASHPPPRRLGTPEHPSSRRRPSPFPHVPRRLAFTPQTVPAPADLPGHNYPPLPAVDLPSLPRTLRPIATTSPSSPLRA